MRRKKAAKAENHERWLITYADLITLLLVFFIVLYAGSQDDSKKFAILAQGLRSAFNNAATNGGGGTTPIFDGTGSTNQGGTQQEITDFESITAILQRVAQEQGFADKLDLQLLPDRITIGLTSDLLFGSGSAGLKESALPALDAVAQVIKDKPNEVRVEGHTDNVPINTADFPSNWELSSARATAVLRRLVDADGVPGNRISAAGYGDTRPKADNKTPDGRAQNRRAAIVLLYPPAGAPTAAATPAARTGKPAATATVPQRANGPQSRPPTPASQR